MIKTDEERFESKVDRSGGPDACHIWTAGRSNGYGRFWGGEYRIGNKPRLVLAHRWAYEHFVGPIPEGLSVLHRCDNPPCVNPAHLWLGTKADNNADRSIKGRDAHPQGEQNGRSKLTEDDVREIRRRYSQGEYQRVIAADYGLGQTTVSGIVRSVSWAHIEEEVRP